MTLEEELRSAVDAWDRAMIGNDADAIGAFMADEWTIVGPDGRVGTREPFLALVRSGVLTHDEMTSEDVELRLHGDVAIVMSTGISAGHWKGQRFREHERGSNVFVRRDGRWQCVLTHLSKLADE